MYEYINDSNKMNEILSEMYIRRNFSPGQFLFICEIEVEILVTKYAYYLPKYIAFDFCVYEFVCMYTIQDNNACLWRRVYETVSVRLAKLS